MPERLECEVLQKARYINTLTFYLYLYTVSRLISVCNSERIIKIGQYLPKLCSNKKRVQFFDSQCINIYRYLTLMTICHAFSPYLHLATSEM